MNPIQKHALHFFLCTLLFFSASGLHTTSAVVRDADGHSLRDSIALSAFTDGVILSIMEDHKATGATVSILQDGDVLYTRGYGFANISDSIAVDPERTLFRIGSISKLFTWIAVLQQVEAGRLDLDRDVNDYLDSFRVPDTFKEPVTLRSLMSHTPGFEDVLLRLFMREDDRIPDLEEIFQKQMPRRVYPPFEVAAYSNHGSGLAQYLVEKVSGMPFETYAEQHIFDPLGMQSSSFRQPLPHDLAGRLATGYSYRDGRFHEEGFEVVPMAGAGGASSTAADMAVFMETLLNYGMKDTISIIDSTTFAIMKQPVMRQAERMNPLLHGFIDSSPHHVQVIGHGGNTFLFHSNLALFPAHNTGVFVSFSGTEGRMAYRTFMKHFIDRFFPPDMPPPGYISLDTGYLEGFSGTYLATRRPHSDILKAVGLTTNVTIEVEGDQLLYKDFFGQRALMSPVDSTTFHVAEKNTFVGFDRPEGEVASRLFVSDFPVMAAERRGWQYNTTLHVFILLFTLACLLYILIVWPWLYFARRLYNKKPGTRTPLPLFSRTVAYAGALLLMVFYVLLLGSAGGEEIVYGIPAGIRIGLFFPLAAIPFILLMIVNCFYIWKQPKIKNLSRLFYHAATIACILALWQLQFFNMLGWRY